METRAIRRTSRQQPVISLVADVAITRQKAVVNHRAVKVRNKQLNTKNKADTGNTPRLLYCGYTIKHRMLLDREPRHCYIEKHKKHIGGSQ